MDKFWIGLGGQYYQGDQINPTDIEVPQRPDATCTWDGQEWVANVQQQTAITEAGFQAAIQAWLDAAAQSLNYDSIESACTYISDPNTLWANQGRAFVNWRSSVWTQVYTELAEVQAGQINPPTSIEEYIKSLPQPNIPTTVA